MSDHGTSSVDSAFRPCTHADNMLKMVVGPCASRTPVHEVSCTVQTLAPQHARLERGLGATRPLDLSRAQYAKICTSEFNRGM